MRTLFIAVFAFVTIVCFQVASVSAAPENQEVAHLKIGGGIYWQFGQVVQGYDENIPSQVLAHQWTNGALLSLRLNAQPYERVRLSLCPEFKLNYPTVQILNNRESLRPFVVSNFNEANGSTVFGDIDHPYMQLTFGMFTYKYNPDVRNLGEFLFRSGTYPTYLVTDFDFPSARLLGLRLSTDVIENLHADLLITSEAFMYPLYDFSLSAIASYRMFGAIDVGGGINFARLFPVSLERTSPQSSDNLYISQSGDTGYYSFKATKLMARVSIDPKVFFGSPEIFGKEDLKIYGEITTVGLEGYHAASITDTFYHQNTSGVDTVVNPWPTYYNNILQRTPIMVGFNVPAFKLLDVLSAEAEYFPNPIPNDYYLVLSKLTPMPSLKNSVYNADNYKDGYLRWSIFAKKNIMNCFSITGQVAFDHLRNTFWNGSTNDYESMRKKGDWHWELKAGYYF